ncbi:hypothetical protein GGX14DRAFT_560555 [Mycena pura]|uniref:Uncharacterized protein n=1 Tax=Mycena pura TaxID=153505 RepID=A0AAD6YIH1_9AGAR|nr:hypothetical protein GGX14DRAFT_560555 [Mycena pura]
MAPPTQQPRSRSQAHLLSSTPLRKVPSTEAQKNPYPSQWSPPRGASQQASEPREPWWRRYERESHRCKPATPVARSPSRESLKDSQTSQATMLKERPRLGDTSWHKERLAILKRQHARAAAMFPTWNRSPVSPSGSHRPASTPEPVLQTRWGDTWGAEPSLPHDAHLPTTRSLGESPSSGPTLQPYVSPHLRVQRSQPYVPPYLREQRDHSGGTGNGTSFIGSKPTTSAAPIEVPVSRPSPQSPTPTRQRSQLLVQQPGSLVKATSCAPFRSNTPATSVTLRRTRARSGASAKLVAGKREDSRVRSGPRSLQNSSFLSPVPPWPPPPSSCSSNPLPVPPWPPPHCRNLVQPHRRCGASDVATASHISTTWPRPSSSPLSSSGLSPLGVKRPGCIEALYYSLVWYPTAYGPRRTRESTALAARLWLATPAPSKCARPPAARARICLWRRPSRGRLTDEPGRFRSCARVALIRLRVPGRSATLSACWPSNLGTHLLCIRRRQPWSSVHARSWSRAPGKRTLSPTRAITHHVAALWSRTSVRPLRYSPAHAPARCPGAYRLWTLTHGSRLHGASKRIGQRVQPPGAHLHPIAHMPVRLCAPRPTHLSLKRRTPRFLARVHRACARPPLSGMQYCLCVLCGALPVYSVARMSIVRASPERRPHSFLTRVSCVHLCPSPRRYPNRPCAISSAQTPCVCWVLDARQADVYVYAFITAAYLGIPGQPVPRTRSPIVTARFSFGFRRACGAIHFPLVSIGASRCTGLQRSLLLGNNTFPPTKSAPLEVAATEWGRPLLAAYCLAGAPRSERVLEYLCRLVRLALVQYIDFCNLLSLIYSASTTDVSRLPCRALLRGMAVLLLPRSIHGQRTTRKTGSTTDAELYRPAPSLSIETLHGDLNAAVSMFASRGSELLRCNHQRPLCAKSPHTTAVSVPARALSWLHPSRCTHARGILRSLQLTVHICTSTYLHAAAFERPCTMVNSAAVERLLGLHVAPRLRVVDQRYRTQTSTRRGSTRRASTKPRIGGSLARLRPIPMVEPPVFSSTNPCSHRHTHTIGVPRLSRLAARISVHLLSVRYRTRPLQRLQRLDVNYRVVERLTRLPIVLLLVLQSPNPVLTPLAEILKLPWCRVCARSYLLASRVVPSSRPHARVVREELQTGERLTRLHPILLVTEHSHTKMKLLSSDFQDVTHECEEDSEEKERVIQSLSTLHLCLLRAALGRCVATQGHPQPQRMEYCRRSAIRHAEYARPCRKLGARHEPTLCDRLATAVAVQPNERVLENRVSTTVETACEQSAVRATAKTCTDRHVTNSVQCGATHLALHYSIPANARHFEHATLHSVAPHIRAACLTEVRGARSAHSVAPLQCYWELSVVSPAWGAVPRLTSGKERSERIGVGERLSTHLSCATMHSRCASATQLGARAARPLMTPAPMAPSTTPLEILKLPHYRVRAPSHSLDFRMVPLLHLSPRVLREEPRSGERLTRLHLVLLVKECGITQRILFSCDYEYLTHESKCVQRSRWYTSSREPARQLSWSRARLYPSAHSAVHTPRNTAQCSFALQVCDLECMIVSSDWGAVLRLTSSEGEECLPAQLQMDRRACLDKPPALLAQVARRTGGSQRAACGTAMQEHLKWGERSEGIEVSEISNTHLSGTTTRPRPTCLHRDAWNCRVAAPGLPQLQCARVKCYHRSVSHRIEGTPPCRKIGARKGLESCIKIVAASSVLQPKATVSGGKVASRREHYWMSARFSASRVTDASGPEGCSANLLRYLSFPASCLWSGSSKSESLENAGGASQSRHRIRETESRVTTILLPPPRRERCSPCQWHPASTRGSSGLAGPSIPGAVQQLPNGGTRPPPEMRISSPWYPNASLRAHESASSRPATMELNKFTRLPTDARIRLWRCPLSGRLANMRSCSWRCTDIARLRVQVPVRPLSSPHSPFPATASILDAKPYSTTDEPQRLTSAPALSRCATQACSQRMHAFPGVRAHLWRRPSSGCLYRHLRPHALATARHPSPWLAPVRRIALLRGCLLAHAATLPKCGLYAMSSRRGKAPARHGTPPYLASTRLFVERPNPHAPGPPNSARLCVHVHRRIHRWRCNLSGCLVDGRRRSRSRAHALALRVAFATYASVSRSRFNSTSPQVPEAMFSSNTRARLFIERPSLRMSFPFTCARPCASTRMLPFTCMPDHLISSRDTRPAGVMSLSIVVVSQRRYPYRRSDVRLLFSRGLEVSLRAKALKALLCTREPLWALVLIETIPPSHPLARPQAGCISAPRTLMEWRNRVQATEVRSALQGCTSLFACQLLLDDEAIMQSDDVFELPASRSVERLHCDVKVSAIAMLTGSTAGRPHHASLRMPCLAPALHHDVLALYEAGISRHRLVREFQVLSAWGAIGNTHQTFQPTNTSRQLATTRDKVNVVVIELSTPASLSRNLGLLGCDARATVPRPKPPVQVCFTRCPAAALRHKCNRHCVGHCCAHSYLCAVPRRWPTCAWQHSTGATRLSRYEARYPSLDAGVASERIIEQGTPWGAVHPGSEECFNTKLNLLSIYSTISPTHHWRQDHNEAVPSSNAAHVYIGCAVSGCDAAAREVAYALTQCRIPTRSSLAERLVVPRPYSCMPSRSLNLRVLSVRRSCTGVVEAESRSKERLAWLLLVLLIAWHSKSKLFPFDFNDIDLPIDTYQRSTMRKTSSNTGTKCFTSVSSTACACVARHQAAARKHKHRWRMLQRHRASWNSHQRIPWRTIPGRWRLMSRNVAGIFSSCRDVAGMNNVTTREKIGRHNCQYPPALVTPQRILTAIVQALRKRILLKCSETQRPPERLPQVVCVPVLAQALYLHDSHRLRGPPSNHAGSRAAASQLSTECRCWSQAVVSWARTRAPHPRLCCARSGIDSSGVYDHCPWKRRSPSTYLHPLSMTVPAPCPASTEHKCLSGEEVSGEQAREHGSGSAALCCCISSC